MQRPPLCDTQSTVGHHINYKIQSISWDRYCFHCVHRKCLTVSIVSVQHWTVTKGWQLQKLITEHFWRNFVSWLLDFRFATDTGKLLINYVSFICEISYDFIQKISFRLRLTWSLQKKGQQIWHCTCWLPCLTHEITCTPVSKDLIIDTGNTAHPEIEPQRE